jgi:TPR repeat protein
MTVEDEQAFTNEPVSLAVNVEPATDNELLLFNGLAQGTTLSAGTSISPSSWQVPPGKLSGLYLYAPKDFVGVMNTTVNLLGPDKTLLDSRDMRLKWLSRPPQQASQPTVASASNEVPTGVHGSAAPPDAPAVKSIDPGEAALLMQRGRDSLSTGDISAARVAFRRLADAGMPDAALALANTYDPAYLAAHNVVGVVGDRALARTLYQRAKNLGSTEASRILADMMTQ